VFILDVIISNSGSENWRQESMKFDVCLADRKSYILVHPQETTTWEGIVECLSKATELAQKHGLGGYLIDIRGISSGFSPTQHYRIAYQEGRKLGFVAGSRIALLVSAGDPTRDFVEIVVKNAGYQCQRFEEESEAIEWLEK
jgi:hypothetical protein